MRTKRKKQFSTVVETRHATSLRRRTTIGIIAALLLMALMPQTASAATASDEIAAAYADALAREGSMLHGFYQESDLQDYLQWVTYYFTVKGSTIDLLASYNLEIDWDGMDSFSGFQITITSFTAPITGDSSNPDGTDGSCVFNVKLHVREIGTGAAQPDIDAGTYTIAVFAPPLPDSPPTIVGVAPSGADAPISGNVVITFSRGLDMGAGTVELNDITLTKPGISDGDTFAGAGSWSDIFRTYTVPYSGLSYETD